MRDYSKKAGSREGFKKRHGQARCRPRIGEPNGAAAKIEKHYESNTARRTGRRQRHAGQDTLGHSSYTADINRRHPARKRKNKTVLGIKAKEFMDRGALVTDDIVVSMVEERLMMNDCAAGFLLDGFPRNLKQAEALEAQLAGIGKGIGHVIGIEVDRKMLLKRLSGRRVCRKCGANYHIFSQPLNMGACDKCGSEIYQREDDKEETIEARLAVYEQETFPAHRALY